jgi:hypothetical protein
LRSIAPMTVTIRRGPRRRLARLVAAPAVLEIRGAELSAAQEALYLLRAQKTLRNWRLSGHGPTYMIVAGHPRYRIAGTEEWIAEHVTGPGRRHRYFPVGRVGPEQVAVYLGKSARQLEDMRRDGYGPPWLNLAGVVSYWIPEVVRWARQRGIQSKYAMRPVVGKVVVKPQFVHAPGIEALAEAQVMAHAQAPR